MATAQPARTRIARVAGLLAAVAALALLFVVASAGAANAATRRPLAQPALSPSTNPRGAHGRVRPLRRCRRVLKRVRRGGSVRRIRVTRCIRRRARATQRRRSASRAPSWRGDFETGNTSQWDGLNGNRSQMSRYFGMVGAPALSGSRYAMAATVDANATVGGQAGQRSLTLLYPNDVPSQNKSRAFEGSEAWYRSALYFPASFRPAPNNSWNWVMEWHNWPDNACCANLAISTDTSGGGERLSMRLMGGGSPTHPIDNTSAFDNPDAHVDWYVGDPALRREHWYDVLVHVKWSANASRGLVEWWLDGRLIMSRQTSTLFWYADNNPNFSGATPGPGQAYFMEGYYRPTTLPNGQTDTTTATVYHDGAKIGPTRDSLG